MAHGGRFDSPDERDAWEAKVAQRAEAEERRADEFIEKEREFYVPPPKRERFVIAPDVKINPEEWPGGAEALASLRAAFEMEQAKARSAAKFGPGEPVVAGAHYGPVDPGYAAPSKWQVAGQHYADLPIQPSEFIQRNGLGWCEGNAVKYISRHKRKGGREDIQKAIHYLELLLEWEYGND